MIALVVYEVPSINCVHFQGDYVESGNSLIFIVQVVFDNERLGDLRT